MIYNALKKRCRWYSIINKKKCLAGCAISFVTCFLFFVYAPLELYLTNQNEFWFDIYSLLFPVLAQLLGGLTINIIFFFLIHSISTALYTLFCYIEFVFLVVCYVHGTFLSGTLEVLNGTKLHVTNKQLLISYVITTIVILVAFFMLFKQSIKKKLFTHISVVMSLILAVSILIEFVCYKGYVIKDDYCVTTYNLMTYSDTENLIIILIDAVSADTFYETQNSKNDFLKDFTFYRNTCGSFPFTTPSIALMWTGKKWDLQEDFQYYIQNAMDQSELFRCLHEQGYLVGNYCRLLGESYQFNADTMKSFDNIKKVQKEFTSYKDFFNQMDLLVAYRYFPFYLKTYIRNSELDFDDLCRIKESEEYEFFRWDNMLFYENIIGKQIITTKEKCFKFIHLEGGHSPFHLDGNMCEISERDWLDYSAEQDQVEGCCYMLQKYLESLKQAQVYDNSTIVILADHGERINRNNEYNALNRGLNPFLIIKGANERHSEMDISDAPISHEDLAQAFTKIVSTHSAEECFDWREGDERDRLFYYYYSASDVWTRERPIIEYVIKGNIYSNYEAVPTGRQY